jgi:hypothetical protein
MDDSLTIAELLLAKTACDLAWATMQSAAVADQYRKLSSRLQMLADATRRRLALLRETQPLAPRKKSR